MIYRIPFLHAYKASGDLNYIPSTHIDKGTLTVRGVLCDTIQTINSKVRDRVFEGTWDEIHAWRKMVEVDENPGRPYIAGCTVEDAFLANHLSGYVGYLGHENRYCLKEKACWR